MTEAELIREPLLRIYADLDQAVSEAGPTCRLSGRCCRFEEYGHTLFLSAIEAAVLLADAPPPSRPLDDGEHCPWQDHRGHCTARNARPLGCRVYYCEESYQESAVALSERFLDRLKRLTDQLGLRWDYAPLHRHLRAALDDGRYPERDPCDQGIP